MGAEFNAFTDKEYCCVYADFIDEHLDRCAELLFDIILNPSFQSGHIITEKKVISEEIKMVEDNPSDNVFNYFYKEIFEGHPLSLPILGTRDTLRRIGKTNTLKYFRNFFKVNDMVISAAGNIKHRDLVGLIKRNLQKTGGSRSSASGVTCVPPAQKVSIKRVHNGKTKATHICFGGLGCSRYDEDRYALSLFTNLLGGSMSSRLFQKIREDEGLSYSIYSSNVQYKDTGVHLIYSASSPRNVPRILELIGKEINDIRTGGVKTSEFETAKENIKGNIVLGVEDVSSRMFRLGKNLLFDKNVLTIDGILKKIDKITIDDMNRIALKYFNPCNMSSVIYGKTSENVSKAGQV